jgi:peptide chain release factor 3
MVIDAARGIEAQTRKLFEVCRLRSIPIITFVNKVDREGKEPFELLDEIADVLALDVAPMSWPVGMGGTFEGVYDFVSNRLNLPAKSDSGHFEGEFVQFTGLDDPKLGETVSSEGLARLREEASLALAAYPSFDSDAYLGGDLTPVYFGSALKEFGVSELIGALGKIAPSPLPQPSSRGPVDPDLDAVTGFIFKVQANMNPQHRDRVAFMRLCSGRFKRGMKLLQPSTGKSIAVHSPILFFAQNRELADEAFPGDIIGIPNHGTLRVGDTLTEEADVQFTGLPNFAPEILRRVVLTDPTKTKQLRKALDDMAEEGVTQVFYPSLGANWIVGVVGQLQLDVLISRLEVEYKVDARFEPSPWNTARWLAADNPADLKAFVDTHKSAVATDRDGAPVFMAKDLWELNFHEGRNPKIRFTATKERS